MGQNAKPDFVINECALKHTPGSDFSHFEPFDGGDPVQSLLKVVAGEWRPEFGNFEGPRTELRLDQAAMAKYGKFYAPVCIVDESTPLLAYYRVRERAVDGELPYLQARVVGARKKEATSAGIGIYKQEALELEERMLDGVLLDAKFHVIILLCYLDGKQSPMAPVTLMRNHSALVAPGSPEAKGGTATDVTAQMYLDSLLYWRNKLLGTTRGLTLDGDSSHEVCKLEYMGLAPVNPGTEIEAFFAPAVPGGVPFVQFRAKNRKSRPSGKLKPRSPFELACSHARYLGLPEGEGLVGAAYEPHAEQYRRAIREYMDKVHCDITVS